MTRTRLLALAFVPLAAVAHAQEEVGKLSVVRLVKVTNRPVTDPAAQYVDASNDQRVKNHYGLRTGRRSKAEIHFDDKSVLRVNERTDMIINDPGAGQRHVDLKAGAVWIKVAKGVNTTISTPTATATARGTQFEVRSNGEILVYEGSVAVHPTGGGQTVLVEAGNKVSVGTGGQLSSPSPLSPTETPQGQGGGTAEWFNNVEQDAGLLVPAGTSDFTQLRKDPINEAPAQIIDETSTVVIIRGRTRAPIPDARREFGLIDNTDSNYLFPAAGLAATIALDYKNLGTIEPPAVHGNLYSYYGRPSFGGLRVEAVGSVGNSTYAYEANALQFWHDPSTDVVSGFGSVLDIERRLNDHIRVFAGRRKFYHGPVFSNLADTQLIANRFSSVGAHIDQGPLSAEFAYIHDSNRFVKGAQNGALASVFYKTYGGLIGGHFLTTDEMPGGGNGSSVSLSMPVIKNLLDGYGEYGTGIDGTKNTTVGAYLPGFFQKTGVDVFLEYGLKKGVNQAYSITGVYEIKKGPQIRASMDWLNGTPMLNVGASFRF